MKAKLSAWLETKYKNICSVNWVRGPFQGNELPAQSALTCVKARMLLHAPLAHKRLLTVFTLELLGDVVQRSVHLQAVLVGESLAADLAGVRSHARVIQHVDPQGVKLR